MTLLAQAAPLDHATIETNDILFYLLVVATFTLVPFTIGSVIAWVVGVKTDRTRLTAWGRRISLFGLVGLGFMAVVFIGIFLGV